ncbi:MAG: U32 family peptidase [Bacteroidales bacterium]|nr:U32 family peptidase [Bacteroidales bacterium]MBO5853843.1 U32 family peptidase [Bacteroidales bacterium]
MKKIELLSPAKNLEVGIAAINHGADAVYIGGPSFGAREKVGNSIEDIEALCRHAALFDAKVYVTMNTLLFDNELEDARKLAYDCWNAGVDALIVQDMALLNMDMPPIALHASTQCHNIEAEKVKFLEDVGFSQVVLARELSIEQIKDIRSKTTVPLEYFIHGALCVSYSGQCYLSHVIGGRSANRGACAQPCRLAWNLENKEGKRLISNRHLLSLRDLNNSKNIEELIDAGITSFKIEGRLKDIDYVKNVTAYYRKKIDEIIERRDDICRSSRGESNPTFYPAPEKSFSRGFTDYFIHGRQKYIDAPYSPKSMGEYLGTIEKVKNKSITIKTGKELHNGDGLCFLDRENNLLGFNVNAVSRDASMSPAIKHIDTSKNRQIQRQTITSNTDISMATRFKIEGSKIFRNSDLVWQKEVEKSNGNRKQKISLRFTDTEDGFALSAKLYNEECEYVTTNISIEKEVAINTEKALDNIKSKLSQWGDTEFAVEEIDVDFKDNKTTRLQDYKSEPMANSQQPIAYFIRASVLGEMKKDLVEKLKSYLIEKHRNERDTFVRPETNAIFPKDNLSYLGNVINKKSKEFYEMHGVEIIEDGLEKLRSDEELVVMTTKHCVRYANNICCKEIGKPAESLYLFNEKGRFRLDFDCRNCCMKVIKEK